MSGLTNHGNTCYVNSIIQVLRYTKPVVKELINETPSTKEMRAFLDLLYQASDPKEFVTYLGKLGFASGMQHDAHEFMITMLDKLYESVPQKNPFEGTFRTTLTCKNGHTRKAQQPFTSLSINGSVEEGIQELQQPEEVECKCEECDLKHMTKQTFIEPGKAVCVHIKRFDTQRKLNYDVPVTPSWNNFKLVGICNHFGSNQGGHYTACGLTDDGWIMFNDNLTHKLDKLPKKSKLPYIMVYSCVEI